MKITIWPWVLGLTLALCHHPAAGRTVMVDGDPVEWDLAPPIFVNLGHVVRNSDSMGEFVWRDPNSDARTDFGVPETDAEMLEFRATGDISNLYFLIIVSDLTQIAGAGTTQVQIAVDTDQLASSGSTAMAAFSETGISADAAWERLISTRFGSGSLTPDIFDASFISAPAGNAAASLAEDAIEISVPWSALGLSGPPSGPLRLSVALFKADVTDSTFDIFGSSDALDVLSNNDMPGANTPTLDEIGDGTLDYFVDVWFEEDGDVIGPLLITAYESVPGTFTSAEWVEIYNRSGQPLDITNYAIGDEETPGASEGMYRFPAASSIGADSFVIAAKNGMLFEMAVGFGPDYEMDATSASVPDMITDSLWGTGIFDLSNSNDQVLVLDAQRTVIDSIAYGSGGLPGVEFLPAPTPGRVEYRAPIDVDRNLADDFRPAAVDLLTTATNNATELPDGAETVYEIEVSNPGPDSATGGELVLDRIEGLVITDSQCAATDPGTACVPVDATTRFGSFDLPVSTSVSFTITALADRSDEIFARLTIRAAAPAGVGERFPADNIVAESDPILSDLLFSDSFESGL